MLKGIIIVLLSLSVLSIHTNSHLRQTTQTSSTTSNDNQDSSNRRSNNHHPNQKQTQQQQSNKQLIFIQQINTHGLSYPTSQYNSSLYNYTILDKDLGELTDIGRKMQYQLGKIMYKKYWKLLFGSQTLQYQSIKHKFLFKSSSLNRTVESALSFIYGLYQTLPVDNLTVSNISLLKPPYEDEQIDISEATGPIYGYNGKQNHFIRVQEQYPNMSQQNQGGSLQKSNPKSCPSSNNWASQNYQQSHYNKILNSTQFQAALKFYNLIVNQNLTFQQFRQNYQNHLIINNMGFILSKQLNFSQAIKSNLDKLYTLAKYIQFTGNKHQVQAYSIPLTKDIITNLKNAKRNSNFTKWIIYSSDDITIMSVLALMDLANPECIIKSFNSDQNRNTNHEKTCINAVPPFSSSLVFQLYKDLEKQSHSFKLKYNGKYLRIPFCNYKMECLIQDAEKWFHSYQKIDVKKLCGFYNQKQNSNKYFNSYNQKPQQLDQSQTKQNTQQSQYSSQKSGDNNFVNKGQTSQTSQNNNYQSQQSISGQKSSDTVKKSQQSFSNNNNNDNQNSKENNSKSKGRSKN